MSSFVSPLSVSITATTSSTVKLPDLISFTVPLILGGIMILVQDRGRLLHRAEHVAADQVVSHLGDSGEVPLLLAVERGDLLAARQEVAARLLADDLQRRWMPS